MKKILYLSNAAIKNLETSRIGSFSLAAYKAIKALGIEYHCNTFSPKTAKYQEEDDIYMHLVQIYRNPFSKDVYVAYKQLMKLLKEEHFDAIHCNTPIGGFLGRICGKKAGVPKIIYQAHGFHFYKGAPLRNWFVFYPIEKWLARYTDALITINQEDYELAKSKFRLRNNGKVYYVPGVGIDLSKYTSEVNREELRKSIGIGDDEVMLISAGDLIERKDYKTAIKAIADAKDSNIKYCICGRGPLLEELKQYAKEFEVEKQILFLGFRKDVKDLLKVADIFLFTTKQEGLPRSMMEAMASGLPCIASKIRGNTDLLEEGKGGYFCEVGNAAEFAVAIKELAQDAEKRRCFGEANLKHILNFDISAISEEIQQIYTRELQLADNQGGVIKNFIQYLPVRYRKRCELGLSTDDVAMISVGRLDKNKNNETTLKALAKVPNVKLLLCGEGEERQDLENLSRELGISDRVFFLGHCSDVKEIYQAADIFVLMSFREGLSRSIMEAMASGLPCIVSNIRGNVDLITSEKNGFLCDLNNPADLVAAIQMLANDSSLRKFIGKNNLEHIKNYSTETITKSLAEVYSTMLF